MKKLKVFEDFTSVKFGDIIGQNWSADYHINKKKGKSPYTKGPGGVLLEVEPKKSLTKDTIYLSSDQVDKYNKITQEINKLKEEQNNLLMDRENILNK